MDALKAVLASNGIDTASLRRMEEAEDELFLLTVPGADAFPLWRKLRALVAQTGRWPLILGGDEDLEMHVENFEESEGSVAEILQAAARINAETWFASNGADDDSEDGEDDEVEEWEEALEEHAAEQDGGAATADAEAPDGGFTIARDILTGKPLPEAHLALLPTPRGWESAAYLRFGGWNSCPEPAVHVALWRRWSELYGAEVVGNSHDVIEGLSCRPPAEPDAAAKLANEQYAYCDDIVSQGVGSIARLAELLLNRGTWYFWWD